VVIIFVIIIETLILKNNNKSMRPLKMITVYTLILNRKKSFT